jgi:6-phosphofructo-2-kinase/fructose-2,6-biphosphatase 4
MCVLCDWLTVHQSYHDLAVRLEPIILELEREQNDLLIIAHESVLRVLYAYLMHCSTMDIPSLKFPRDEIIEIIPAAYQNESKRIKIPGLDPKIVPPSPDDIKIPVPGGSLPGSGMTSGVQSSQMSPMPGGGLGTPSESIERLPDKGISLPPSLVADKVDDED